METNYFGVDVLAKTDSGEMPEVLNRTLSC